MKNRERHILIIVSCVAVAMIICIMICYYRKPNKSVHGDDLAIYENELQKLNEELGTNYQLSPTGDDTYEDMVAFYTGMTIEEFDAYIREAYEKEIEFNKRVGEGVAIPVND